MIYIDYDFTDGPFLDYSEDDFYLNDVNEEDDDSFENNIDLDEIEELKIITFAIDENDIDNIKRYFFESKYRKKYNILGWWLEDGAKDYLKSIEEKYWANQLDMTKYKDYVDWLTSDKYDAAYDKCCKQVAEYINNNQM